MWHEFSHIGDSHLHLDDHKTVHGETHADTHAARTVSQAIADGHGDLIGFDLASRIYTQRMVGSFIAPGNDGDFDLHLNGVVPAVNSDKILFGPKIALDYQVSKPTHTTHIFQVAANPIQQEQMKTEMVSGNTDLNIYLARNELFQGIEGLEGENLRAFVKYKLMDDGDLSLDLSLIHI